MEEQKPQTSLPENAYRELKPGEEYRPLMPAASSPTEVDRKSICLFLVQ